MRDYNPLTNPARVANISSHLKNRCSKFSIQAGVDSDVLRVFDEQNRAFVSIEFMDNFAVLVFSSTVYLVRTVEVDGLFSILRETSSDWSSMAELLNKTAISMPCKEYEEEKYKARERKWAGAGWQDMNGAESKYFEGIVRQWMSRPFEDSQPQKYLLKLDIREMYESDDELLVEEDFVRKFYGAMKRVQSPTWWCCIWHVCYAKLHVKHDAQLEPFAEDWKIPVFAREPPPRQRMVSDPVVFASEDLGSGLASIKHECFIWGEVLVNALIETSPLLLQNRNLLRV